MDEARPRKMNLPAWTMPTASSWRPPKSAQALADDALDQRQASLPACHFRLAAGNVGRLDFEKQEDER